MSRVEQIHGRTEMSLQIGRGTIERPAFGWPKVLGIALTGFSCSLLVVACATGYRPLPNEVYSDKEYTEFKDLPAELQKPEVNMLFITDRQWDQDADDGPKYTFRRSPTMEFGYATIDVGQEWTWDELVDWTLSDSEDTTATEAEMTVPSTIGEEKTTNPFIRVDSPEIIESVRKASPTAATDGVSILGTVRAMKDSF